MTLRALLREPLVHFLVLGALLFALYALVDDAPAPGADAGSGRTLVVTEADLDRLVRQFEATWRRPPNAAERRNLVTGFVEEEVLVREARALGLDRGDAIVRQRLAQKMGFLIESGAEAAEATEADLQAHLDAYPERFERPALIAFDQVPLGGRAAGPVLAALAEGAAPDEFASGGVLPRAVHAAPLHAVDGTFGRGFFEAVAALPPGEWSGPVDSAYGRHLVRLKEVMPTRMPDLSEIREAVEGDWRAEMRGRLAAERFAALKDRYDIVLPEGVAPAE